MGSFDAIRAFDLLVRRCEELSVTQVAARIGYSRTAVSLVLNGRYSAGADKLLRKVVAVFGKIDCPYLGQAITAADCAGYALRACPTHNPSQMQFWRVCRICPSRPGEPE
jgi:hypothetical protein